MSTITSFPSIGSIDPANDVLPIVDVSLNTTNKVTPNALFGITGSVVGTTDTQTVKNKVFDNTNSLTILDGSLTIQDNVDPTKQAQFQLSGNTTGTTRTYALPNASVTLASLTGTETLTNKTITSPTITGGSIDNTTITVDSISGHTTATIVTVGGVQMNNGIVATAGAVNTNSIAAGAVVPNSLIASSGSGWAWQTFVPSWTNFTPGNGVVTARYTQIGKMVWLYLAVTLGSTSSVTGSIGFTPPVAASSVYTTVATNTVIGFGTIFAGSSGFLPAPFFNASNASIFVGYFSPSATTASLAVTSSSAPGTWGTGNNFLITCFYEAA